MTDRKEHVYQCTISACLFFTLFLFTSLLYLLPSIFLNVTSNNQRFATETRSCALKMKRIDLSMEWLRRARRRVARGVGEGAFSSAPPGIMPTASFYGSTWTMAAMRPCCRPGPAGVAGSPGKNGEHGSPGLPGIHGKPGSVPWNYSCEFLYRLPCPPCPQGDVGAPGDAGKPGDTGAPGFAGTPGKPGLNGLRGADGQSGIEGRPGVDGSPGIPGVPATPEPLIPGSRGDAGDPGALGPEGPPGSPGLPGTNSVLGERGSKGHQGLSGSVGLQGFPGPVGEQGAPGNIGVCPTYCANDGGVFYTDPR